MSRRVTIQDIAKESGRSKSTVSRALTGNGYVDDESREIVIKTARRLGYVPPKSSRNAGHDELVMVATPLLSSQIQVELIEGIAEELEAVSKKVFLVYEKFGSPQLLSYLEYADKKSFSGVILLGALETPQLTSTLKSINLPMVLLNQNIRGLDVNVVEMDDYKGGYLAAKYLIECGHEQLGLLMGYENATAVSKREKGFRDALEDNGIAGCERFIEYGDFTEKSGYAYAERIATENWPITAVVSCNDLMTVGLTYKLLQLGKRVPGDISVVGFDNSLVTRVGLINHTTIQYEFKEMGKTAASMLLENILRPEQPKRCIRFSPLLIEGDSTTKRN